MEYSQHTPCANCLDLQAEIASLKAELKLSTKSSQRLEVIEEIRNLYKDKDYHWNTANELKEDLLSKLDQLSTNDQNTGQLSKEEE